MVNSIPMCKLNKDQNGEIINEESNDGVIVPKKEPEEANCPAKKISDWVRMKQKAEGQNKQSRL